MVKRESKLISNQNIENDDDKVPIFSIKFLLGGKERLSGVIVAVCQRLYTTRSGECTTAPHYLLKVVAEELLVGNNEVGVVMEKPSPCVPGYSAKLGSIQGRESLGF